MSYNLPPGYSMITIKVLGKDIPLVALNEDTLSGIKKIVEGLKKGPPVTIKLQDGRKTHGYIKKRTPYGAIIDVGGKEIVARVKKDVKPPVVKTKITVEKP